MANSLEKVIDIVDDKSNTDRDIQLEWISAGVEDKVKTIWADEGHVYIGADNGLHILGMRRVPDGVKPIVKYSDSKIISIDQRSKNLMSALAQDEFFVFNSSTKLWKVTGNNFPTSTAVSSAGSNTSIFVASYSGFIIKYNKDGTNRVPRWNETSTGEYQLIGDIINTGLAIHHIAEDVNNNILIVGSKDNVYGLWSMNLVGELDRSEHKPKLICDLSDLPGLSKIYTRKMSSYFVFDDNSFARFDREKMEFNWRAKIIKDDKVVPIADMTNSDVYGSNIVSICSKNGRLYFITPKAEISKVIGVIHNNQSRLDDVVTSSFKLGRETYIFSIAEREEYTDCHRIASGKLVRKRLY